MKLVLLGIISGGFILCLIGDYIIGPLFTAFVFSLGITICMSNSSGGKRRKNNIF